MHYGRPAISHGPVRKVDPAQIISPVDRHARHRYKTMSYHAGTRRPNRYKSTTRHSTDAVAARANEAEVISTSQAATGELLEPGPTEGQVGKRPLLIWMCRPTREEQRDA